jgi:hypothetical protein
VLSAQHVPWRGKAQLFQLSFETHLVTFYGVDAVYVITPFIHDKNPDAVIAVANSMGITVMRPKP